MRALSIVALFALLSLPACSLSRSALGSPSPDGSLPGDDADLDAAAGDDTALPDDTGTDGGAPDTGPSCTPTSPTETACDRIDDDCDGVIDDDHVCAGCVAITALGHAYLSCPGPVSGMDAWMGACRTTAHGYDLAVFASPTEQNAVITALGAASVTDAHWIGLNDFERHYQWRDRTTTFTPTTIGADDPNTPFVAMRGDGTYEALAGTAQRRYLCEAVLAPGACRATMERASCDGIDDDCNGLVDDGLTCGASNCTPRTFWDHVYYLCVRSQKPSEADMHCADEIHAELASIDGIAEHTFLVQLSPSEAWLGLTQDMSQSGVAVGWHWADGTTGYGVPAAVGLHPWNAGEPNDGGSTTEGDRENCGVLLSTARASELDDRSCNDMLPYLCEKAWSY